MNASDLLDRTAPARILPVEISLGLSKYRNLVEVTASPEGNGKAIDGFLLNDEWRWKNK